ncbi:MAG TPA: EAL domain-containing protein [Oxalicibacterium sp.]|nr:EAL domain-containing protein [Oxalicibacterium sp.]
MRIDGKFLRSRVARRIATLFLVAALLPTSLLAFLTYRDVSRVTLEQQQDELVGASRAYGMALYSRLLFVRTVLENMAKKGEREWLLNADVPIFRSLEHIDAGQAQQWKRAMADSAGRDPALMVHGGGPAKAADIMMAAAMPHRRGNLLAAHVNPRYLWGASEDVDAAYNICIYSKGVQLHCAYPDETGSDDDKLRGEWELSLDPSFGIAPWKVVAVRRFPPRRAHSDFFNLYLAVAGCGVLLIMLLSLIQIRRTMGPLERLIDGTRRIAAGNYDDIRTDSRDEFGDLASAVNAMSARIRRQLSTLQTLSAIDRDMREQLDLPHLIAKIGDAMRQIVPDADLYVLRYAGNERENDRLFVQHGAGTPARENAAPAPSREADMLVQHPLGLLDAAPPSFLPAAFAHNWRIALLWRGRVCGILCLAWNDARALNEETMAELAELANRIAVAIQIEEREQRLLYQARFDSLTGLMNRHGLEERIAHIESGNVPAAVLFVDIDRFKHVNDNFGHRIGDLLLQAIAARLREFAECDTVGRLGGDEFILLLSGASNPTRVTSSASSLMALLTRPFDISGEQFTVTCSIGIALHPAQGADGLTLIERADIAMYRAKQTGRNNFRFYDERMTVENHARLALEFDLRQALGTHEFVLHYQPRVDLKTGHIVGSEALLRWNHGSRGMIAPAHFIGIAEETGLIVPIGTWVLRSACAQQAAWRRDGVAASVVAVNVSTRQFGEPDFVETVAATLAETGLPAECLELELTESMIMDDVEEAILILGRLRALGVKLSIDDFGTGYSSLAYLKRFPISALKIDQSFVRDIVDDQDDRLIVASIIGLAHNLQLKVVAEGVEDVAQLSYLAQQNCDEIQGYHFSPPVTALEFFRMAAARQRLEWPLPDSSVLQTERR